MLFPTNGIVNAKYMGNDMYDVNLMGVEEGYSRGSGQVDIHLGRFFTDEESRRRSNVAVIGADIEKGLFANLDPIGKAITVAGHEYTVIGTMLRPAASFFGDTDSRILLPYGAMQKMYPNARENAIVVTAMNGKPRRRSTRYARSCASIGGAVTTSRYLRALHRGADGLRFPQITAMFSLVMIVLSSIGLLVGGIGVMNISAWSRSRSAPSRSASARPSAPET
jgi:putative ABC transport system permease protein